MSKAPNPGASRPHASRRSARWAVRTSPPARESRYQPRKAKEWVAPALLLSNPLLGFEPKVYGWDSFGNRPIEDDGKHEITSPASAIHPAHRFRTPPCACRRPHRDSIDACLVWRRNFHSALSSVMNMAMASSVSDARHPSTWLRHGDHLHLGSRRAAEIAGLQHQVGAAFHLGWSRNTSCTGSHRCHPDQPDPCCRSSPSAGCHRRRRPGVVP